MTQTLVYVRDLRTGAVHVELRASASQHNVLNTVWGTYCTNGCGFGGCDSQAGE